MTLIRGTLVFFLFFATFSVAQKGNTTDQNCEKDLKTAAIALKEKNFNLATAHFLQAEHYCSQFGQSNYNDLITSLKGSINSGENSTQKTAYIDTLVQVYERAEKKNLYDQNNDLQRALLMLKSSKPDHIKTDQLFERGLKKSGSTAGETVLTLFYFNLYSCYLNAPKDARDYYKRRLINDYFKLISWINETGMSDKTKETIELYFTNAIRSCEDILPEMKSYLSSLSLKEDEKKTELLNFQNVLKTKECVSSNEYEAVIDSLLFIEPTFELWIIRAELHQNKEDYSKEFSALHFAKKLANGADQEELVSFLMAKSLYKTKKYIEAYQLALQITGKKQPEALQLAATSVLRHSPNCGATAEEQQLNLYYAFNLLNEAKKGGAQTEELENELAQKLPSKEVLNKLGLKGGQSILLPCWNVTIILPK
jgi:hypothetical protein